MPGNNGAVTGGPSKIWMSPEIPAQGFHATDAKSWKPIFSWDEYDPDPAVSKGIVWGAVKGWNGDLYIGSYNPAAIGGVQTMWKTYGQPEGDTLRQCDMVEASRAAAIFKIHAPGTDQQKVTLLYGEKRLRLAALVTRHLRACSAPRLPRFPGQAGGSWTTALRG